MNEKERNEAIQNLFYLWVGKNARWYFNYLYLAVVLFLVDAIALVISIIKWVKGTAEWEIAAFLLSGIVIVMISIVVIRHRLFGRFVKDFNDGST